MAIGTENIQEVRNRHSGHWFDAKTMRFFSSRVSETAYLSIDGKRSFFVSSERFDMETPRSYTVRVQDCETGSISTVDEFQRYDSRYNAHKVAKALSKGDVVVCIDYKIDRDSI